MDEDRRTSWAPWVRLVLVGGAAAAVGVVVFFVVAVTVAGAVGGWLWSLLAFGATAGGSVWLAVSPRWPRARRWAAVVAAVVAGVAGIAIARVAAPTPSRLRQALRGLDLPDDRWDRRREAIEGNGLCFDVCFSVTWVYRTAEDPDDVARRVRARVQDLGFDERDPEQDQVFVAAGDRGDVSVDVTVRAVDDVTEVVVRAG